MKEAHEIVQEILDEMSDDNGVVFKPLNSQLEILKRLILGMQLQGCEFTEKEIDILASGEETEMTEMFSKYTDFVELNNLLNDIFDAGGAYDN